MSLKWLDVLFFVFASLPGLRAAGFDRLEFAAGALQLGHDVLDFRGPYERAGFLIPCGQESVDGLDQIRHADEGSAPHCLAGQLAKPTLDQVHPTRTGRNEMGDKARMPFEPPLDLRSLVRPVIVHHQMEGEALWEFAVQAAEKFQELLVPVPGHTLANDLPIQHAQRGKEGRGAVALVIVRHRAAAAPFERQPRLGAVQRLDLALFVHTEHHRLLRRIQIQPDHVGEFLQEKRVAGKFERPSQVRLEIVRLPESLDGVLTHPIRLGHEPAAPVRHAFGLGLEGRLNNGLVLGRTVTRLAAPPGGNLPHTADPLAANPLAPQGSGVAVDRVLRRDFQVLHTVCGGQHQPAAQGDLLRRRGRAQPSGKLLGIEV